MNKKQGKLRFSILTVILLSFLLVAGVVTHFAIQTPSHRAHAAGIPGNGDSNSQSADSLPTNIPDRCFLWDGVQSQLNGGAPAEFVAVLGVGTVEIDDTVYANGCSQFSGSNLIMSGLVFVHWSTFSNGIGSPPPMTVTLQSQATIHAVNASWNATAGATAGASTNDKPSAGATAGINFTVSPSDSTIVNSTATITNQTSAYFSYQNLSASASVGVGGQVTQIDTITISVGPSEQSAHYETIVTPFS